MTFMKKMMSATAALALTAGAAAADPAIVFDLGGKFDKSFNESAFNGAMRWAEETGGSFAEVELQSDAQREQALRRFAESGANPLWRKARPAKGNHQEDALSGQEDAGDAFQNIGSATHHQQNRDKAIEPYPLSGARDPQTRPAKRQN